MNMHGAKDPLREALERRVLLLDGATGTELTRRGVATPLPLWSAGANCIPPDGVTRNLARLRAATPRPLLAYAHLGNPEPITGWSSSPDVSPEAYATEAARWIELGARIVGVCCGTTPAHIAALRRLTKKHEGGP